MYFVDRKQIEEKLTLMEQCLQLLDSKSEWLTEVDKFALERVVHIVVESMIDVGNGIIDGFVMRDPGSYEDIINILLDEKVIDDKDAKGFKAVISLRKMVVRDYVDIDHLLLQQTFKDNHSSLLNFSPSVQKYLKNELGHVTAFIPESK